MIKFVNADKLAAFPAYNEPAILVPSRDETGAISVEVVTANEAEYAGIDLPRLIHRDDLTHLCSDERSAAELAADLAAFLDDTQDEEDEDGITPMVRIDEALADACSERSEVDPEILYDWLYNGMSGQIDHDTDLDDEFETMRAHFRVDFDGEACPPGLLRRKFDAVVAALLGDDEADDEDESEADDE